jgi:CHAT domain-containing protein
MLMRLLVMMPGKSRRASFDEEARAAERALEEAGVDSSVALRGEEATKQNVMRHIKDGGHSVLHFAGHSHYLADTPDESYLQLSGQQLFAHELARAAARSHLQLVFLNSCSSAEMGESLSAGLGLAQSMVHEGVPYVVGMSCSVTDEGAFVLAKEFYSKLSDGEDPSVALALARQRVGVDLSWEDQTRLAQCCSRERLTLGPSQ